MATIHEIKQSEVTETPILLFDCHLASGSVERWSTHRVVVNGDTYDARVLSHDAFEIRAGAEDGIDAVSRTSVVLANADSHFSQLNRAVGFKGAKLTVSFVFFDVSNGVAASETVVVFRGTCNPPDEITESQIRLTFSNRMNMQRVQLPDVRVQRRCPWVFPSTPQQRTEAVDGAAKGRYSRFFRCGYSSDQEGGCGTGNFISCDYTKAQCIERGMFDKDSAGRETRRFGGIEFVPSTISVKTYGEKSMHLSGAVENEGKYNDFVPIVYGNAWYRPPIVFARNDGNLTHMEVLVGMGPIEGVLKVIVNGNELPEGSKAANASATGWYTVVNYGHRNGAFNSDFKSANGSPQGDPCGSMAVLAVVVPNRISDGDPLPKIDVLIQGMKLDAFEVDGTYSGQVFTNNPAWVLLDLLRRSGWHIDEIDILSFAKTAEYCAELIETQDLHGNPQSVPRFQSNLVLRRRRSAADVIRGVRNGSGLYLTYGPGGVLQLHPESSIAIQQPQKPLGSNATEQINGGWPAYEFGDGSTEFTDIVRRANGRPSLRVWSRSIAESPNRFSVEFQDEFNEYQQDSLSLVDVDDAGSTGHEVNGSLTALGIPNFNQAARMIRLALDRSLRGNTYVEFETGLRAFGIKPGDLITLTYRKENYDRQLFRVIRIKPGLNYRTTVITAQIHEDSWYAGGDGSLGLIGGGRQPAQENGTPRPLIGTVLNEDGQTDFEIGEEYVEKLDGTFDVDLSVAFSAPSQPSVNAPAVPLLSLVPKIETTGGSLRGGEDLYYAVSAVDASDVEGPLSFVVRAAVPSGTSANRVTLQGLSFAPETSSFNVYRGLTPTQMIRMAEHQPVAASFTDEGSESIAAAPPDRNYHHANFYWRFELLPEYSAAIHAENKVGNSTLEMIPNEYRGKVARITNGRGRGQERTVASNDATTLNLSSSWSMEPDDTSKFVVAESSWNFGAQVESSPARFVVPNRQNAIVHICGRSANSNDRECAVEVSPITRHTIGGAAADLDVPDAPVFFLNTAGQGRLELAAVGFENFENTRSVIAGTMTLHYWDELAGEPSTVLASDVNENAETLPISGTLSAGIGSLVQIGNEVVVIRSVDVGSVVVERGAYKSAASAHSAGEQVYVLQRRSYVLPFVPGFFGTPASGSYSHSVVLPSARVVVAEMYMTNTRGDSQVTSACYSATLDGGLRTLSGGQFTLQVDGPLAIQSNAVPPVNIDEGRSVRDVFASVVKPSTDSQIIVRVVHDGVSYCDLTIPAGQTKSNVVEGRQLGPLVANKQLGLDIVEAGQALGGAPGAGLTVTVRV